MKAIYNKIGEIVDVEDMSIVTYKSSDGTYVKTLIKNFTFIDAEKDYYTKLEHQYAGMAMQGILSNQDYCKLLIDENNKGSFAEDVSRCASDIAHALIQKLKEKEERK